MTLPGFDVQVCESLSDGQAIVLPSGVAMSCGRCAPCLERAKRKTEKQSQAAKPVEASERLAIPCPYCKSPDVEALGTESTTMGWGFHAIDPNRHTAFCRCASCGKRFDVTYRFAAREEPAR